MPLVQDFLIFSSQRLQNLNWITVLAVGILAWIIYTVSDFHFRVPTTGKFIYDQSVY